MRARLFVNTFLSMCRHWRAVFGEEFARYAALFQEQNVNAAFHSPLDPNGARKEWAERFAWAKTVGSSRLVFARTPEGRRVLLRARAKSMAPGFHRSVERRSACL